MPEPIRVLHPITRLIVGGAQENTMFTAARLDKKRFQVSVVSGPQTGSEGSLIEEVRARGVPLTILPELVREVSPRNDLHALWTLNRMMRQQRCTIVHTHSSKAGILGRFAARLAGVPIIVHTIHGWSFHDYMAPKIRRTYILLERLAASLADALIVVSKQDIEKGLKSGIGRPGKYHLIHSAIPLDEFDPAKYNRSAAQEALGLPQGAFVVGNVGRFSSQKNPLDWVRVASAVARRLPQAYFLLVGDGPLREQVESLLEQEGIANRTLLTGLRRDVARVLAAMDVFLLTSLWEGLPRVIPQAMAMGLPVIANRADGTADAIIDGKNGYLFEARDIAGMSAAVQYLFEHPEVRRSFGQSGRQVACQDFDLNQMVNQIEALYTELLQRKRI
jgi:glycosyltransferase involved in cell wall biosynthesis